MMMDRERDRDAANALIEEVDDKTDGRPPERDRPEQNQPAKSVDQADPASSEDETPKPGERAGIPSHERDRKARL